MTSLLATNDFPPKVGGIQSYLYELWRRLPADETSVFTTAHADAAEWDARQALRIVRADAGFLLPTRAMRRRVDALASEVGADVVFVDPMVPLGAIGPKLTSAPYVVVAHGAEVMVYGRLPVTHRIGRRVLRGAAGVIVAGAYTSSVVTRVAGRAVPTLVLPPGVDPDRFRPVAAEVRAATRAQFGIPIEAALVLGVSRLVPRKGFDVVLDAVHGLDGVHVAIAGTGRDEQRLRRRARRLGDRAHFLGRVSDADLPALYACADVFAMLCRDRWAGLEAEGFGIVFLEAAACGIPVVAGRSGGSAEAVLDGETGHVVEPRDVVAVRDVLGQLLGDDEARTRMGAAARQRAETGYSYDALVQRLAPLARGDLTVFEHP
ncbi:MAG: glycosyltransferase family 4 protein [Actinobacteria bacterium]|nr:glycosyltransferase family 4 protein [Actinomycetota bacterium]